MNRLQLLSKPHFDYHDVMTYIGCGKTKAYEVMKICRRKYNGAIPHEPQCVTRDSVLVYLGSSIEREVYCKKILEEGGRDEKTLQEGEV